MKLRFNRALSEGYSSASQIVRRLSEGWVIDNMYCPRCGNQRIEHCANNSPVSDFICPKCASIFELKSQNRNLGNKVVDGAYETMIKRIASSTNPDFMFLGYNREKMIVNELVVIPKHFFVPAIIERRKPLGQKAKRAGWIGCNILLSNIPMQGRIAIVHNGEEVPQNEVIEKLKRSNTFADRDISSRGWLFDMLNCINAISNDMFTLADMYKFESKLAEIHPDNQNIKAKIRQQLQTLRDAGYLEFLGNGNYRKL